MRRQTIFVRIFAPAFLAVIVAVITSSLHAQSVSEQEPARRPRPVKAKQQVTVLPIDSNQRSAQVLYMERMGKNGADRGQEIYYMKCWICHNDYTRKVDPKAAPTLKGLFQRTKLMSGKAVNEEAVLEQIKEGSAGMPSYKAGLNDKDLADLLSYLKERCCWDEDNPAVNSRYKYAQPPTAVKK